MISNAFKSAVTSEQSAKLQTASTITSGIKDVASAVLMALGFSGTFGEAGQTAAKHFAANKVGGVGGNIMLASLDEKKDTLQNKPDFTREEVTQTISSTLGDNPINRSARKQLNTVFDTLMMAKESGIINKEGKIVSSLGDIDPTSELGKNILGGLSK